MGGDRQFFSNETAGFCSDWDGFSPSIAANTALFYRRDFRVPADDRYFLQYRAHFELLVSVQGNSYRPGKQLLLHNEIPEVSLQLKKGVNNIVIRLENSSGNALPGNFSARLISESGDIIFQETRCPLPSQQAIIGDLDQPCLEGFSPATGAAYKSCGRFGYTKGDGILDCSMAAFGMITKPYISGHPECRKNVIWHLSLLPDGEPHPCSLAENYQPADGESLQVDWAGVRWSRLMQDGIRMTFDYSVLTPEILIETEAKNLYLNELQNFAGFTRVTLPLADGCLTRKHDDGVFYERAKDGPLRQNWLLFSHSGTFPEVPTQMIFREGPEKVSLRLHANGKIIGITMRFAAPVEWAMLVFPFGVELFSPEQLDEEWYAKAASLCAKRQQFALARPVACEDWFRATASSVEVRQKFTFRILKDVLDTPALAVAPLPPPLAIASAELPEMSLDERAISLEFPSKYGPLHGVLGSAWSSYTLPIPSPRRKISFAADNAADLSAMISQDFAAFLSYHRDAPEIGNPGNYSFVFQYSFVLLLFHLLKTDEKRELLAVIRSGLQKVCDPDYQYIGPAGRKCYSWYHRREPFSGVSYYSTYLHVTGVFRYPDCGRRSIENSRWPFIEVDWGNAMSLYGTWLGTLFSGSWELIRANWQVLRKAFDYYLVMMDWACMTTAYSENAVSWNDGTNYGGYLGFLNMAEMLGKKEDLGLARYAYAKMFAMRAGLFFSASKYFCKYFAVPPYRGSKFFHEELDATRAFLSYPSKQLGNGYRCETLYNITTEGHYLEAWDAYCEYMPGEVRELLAAVEQANPDDSIVGPRPAEIEASYHTQNKVLGWQEVMTYLILSLISGRHERSKLLEMLDQASASQRIAGEFLGHLQLSKRRVPAAWAYAYLHNTFMGQDKPALTAWWNLSLVRAAYPEIEVAEVGRSAWLEFFSKKPVRVFMNGSELKMQVLPHGHYRIEIAADGKIVFSI